MEDSKKVKLTETEWIGGFRVWGVGKWGIRWQKGTDFQLQDGHVLGYNLYMVTIVNNTVCIV